MNITPIIKNYQKRLDSEKTTSSIFLGVADSIVNNFSHRLNEKTYLLIPEPRKELIDTSYEYFLYNNKILSIRLSLIISDIIKKFNEVAQKLGFTIITSLDEYLGDGELFDLLGTGFVGEIQDAEKRNDIPNLKTSVTLSVDSFVVNPFFSSCF